MTDQSRENKNNKYKEILIGKNKQADLRLLLAQSDGKAHRKKQSIPGIAVGWTPGRPLPSFHITNILAASVSSEVDLLEAAAAPGSNARGGG